MAVADAVAVKGLQTEQLLHSRQPSSQGKLTGSGAASGAARPE